MLAFFLFTAISAAALPVVILDTDIASDFDDCFALHYLLSVSKPSDPRALVTLPLVQVSTYNTTKRAQVVAYILDSLNRFDVEIGIGDYEGERNMPEWPLAKDYNLSTFLAKGGKISQGLTRMAQVMASGTPAAPVFVTEIAPASSLGGVLMGAPALAAGVAVVAMSGSVRAGYGNSSTIAAEYNVRVNISASQAMYSAEYASPLVTAPLDTTVFDQFNGATYGALLIANASGESPYASSLLAHYEAWYANGGKNYGAMLPFSPFAGPTQGTSTMCVWPAPAHLSPARPGKRRRVVNPPPPSHTHTHTHIHTHTHTSRPRYDVQAAWSTPYYAASLAAPAFPWLRAEAMRLVVNNSGFTVADPAGRPVTVQTLWEPVARTRDVVANFGAEVIAAIIAA
jgi:hypothetical protein